MNCLTFIFQLTLLISVINVFVAAVDGSDPLQDHPVAAAQVDAATMPMVIDETWP